MSVAAGPIAQPQSPEGQEDGELSAPSAGELRPTPEEIQVPVMENLDRGITGGVTPVPPLLLLLAVVHTWNHELHWRDIAIFLIMYLPTGMGVTIGFHRLLNHRSFQTSPALRGVFAVLGTMAVEGPVISWVADHRKHHTYSDRLGDPHSPHVDH